VISFACNHSCTLLGGRPKKGTGIGTAWSAGLLALVLVLFVGLPSPLAHARAAGCRGAGVRPSGTNAAVVDAATLCLIDQIRAAHGLRPLHANAELGAVAASQVTNMVRSDYFADVRPTGQTPMSLVGSTRYRAHAARIAVGQNIAWGTGRYSTPEHIVAEWMASPPHREIILDGEFHDAGTGVTPVLPSVLGAGQHGALYAIELGVRNQRS
jgi:hypothetical protein